jgi:phosphonopyruvate decarboxylase
MTTYMTTQQACTLIHAYRGNAVVVSTMTAMKALDGIAPDAPLSLSSVPLMGGCAGLGLGIAMAQPNLQVLVLDGDASLLMELGVLATVAGAQPQKFVHFIFANGVQFNGNGNLQLPAAKPVDFVAMARAAGYAHAVACKTPAELEAVLSLMMQWAGPVLVEIAIEPDPPALGPGSPGPEQPDKRFERMGKEARAVMSALGVSL